MNWTSMVAAGSFLGALSVLTGAFGAHVLKLKVSASALETFKTGASYHQTHALALILCGLLASRIDSNLLKSASFAFIIGILLFSGSLYALTVTSNRSLGMITPIGGIFLVAGWTLMGIAIIKA